jgi:hypothetical protein
MRLDNQGRRVPSLPLWCAATGVASLGLMVYLPLGSLPSFAGFSENPWALTLAMAVSGVVSVWLAVKMGSGPLRIIRTTLFFGAFLAVMGNVNYLGYVYYYSHTVPGSESAPAVGASAPDFAVPDPSGGSWTLDAYAGTPILLVFYRAHW